MQEDGRGSYDFRTADNVMLVRWADNSVVTAATNFENRTIGTANRWSREKKNQNPSTTTHYVLIVQQRYGRS